MDAQTKFGYPYWVLRPATDASTTEFWPSALGSLTNSEMLSSRLPKLDVGSRLNAGLLVVLTMWSATVRHSETMPSVCQVVVQLRDCSSAVVDAPLHASLNRVGLCVDPQRETRIDAVRRIVLECGVVDQVARADLTIELLGAQASLVGVVGPRVGGRHRSLRRDEKG